MSMKLYQISDLHIHMNDKDNKVIKERLAWLSTKATATDTIVVTGDITDDGVNEQYSHALKYLKDLRQATKSSLILIPGNHDYGILGNIYVPSSKKAFWKMVKELGDNNQSALSPFKILPIDTCLASSNPLDFAQGKLGWYNAIKIKSFALLCKKMHKLSIIACHHTPFDNNYFLRLQDRERFMTVVSGNVNGVLVGHEHKYRLLFQQFQNTVTGQCNTLFHSSINMFIDGSKIVDDEWQWCRCFDAHSFVTGDPAGY